MKMKAMFVLLMSIIIAASAFAYDIVEPASYVDVPAGDLEGVTYWTADQGYKLMGRVVVPDGAELHIEAGTIIKGIEADSINAALLVVARGGKIYAEGTATRPIIFTAWADDVENPLEPSYLARGLWGGVIILGKAPASGTAGEVYEGQIEGIPSDVAAGAYGGTDPEDCSGVFRYVSIRHGGISIGNNNEINGLTMGGVGRGTKIDHVEVFANLDDGFEWFGGTVNCHHLAVAFCGDDAFDMDKGLNLKLQYLFAIMDDTDGDKCGEHDGMKRQADEPEAYAQVYNATYIGAGFEAAKVKKEIFKLRDWWGGEYKNSIFGWNADGKAGVTCIGTDEEDDDNNEAQTRFDAGEIIFENNIFNLGASSSMAKQAWFQTYLEGAGNTEEDPGLMGVSRELASNGLDPRPAQDGPAFTGTMADYPADDTFFDRVGYKGAFGATNWLLGWTALDQYGIVKRTEVAKGMGTVNVAAGDLPAGKTFWTADNEYILQGRVVVPAGAELYIEAGTAIKGIEADSINAAVLVVARDGKIFAEGTGDRPIVFTAAEDDLENPLEPSYLARGLWGGVIMLGNAPASGTAGEVYEGQIEGIPSDVTAGAYGGTDENDCSGVFRYCSIRHGGISIGNNNEINGLTMGGVGRGTKIDHVEVFANLDDGFEWFGGTVNCDHLVVAFCGDDAFDMDKGLNVQLQNLFAIMDDTDGDKCGEHDGMKRQADEPEAYAQVYNATYIGAGFEAAKVKKEIFKLRDWWGGEYKNSIFGWNADGKAGVTCIGTDEEDDDNNEAQTRFDAGEIIFENNIWNLGSASSLAKQSWFQTYLEGADNVVADPELMGVARELGSAGLDPRPAHDGAAFSGMDADELPAAGDFYAVLPYKGAFGVTNWLNEWTGLAAYGIVGESSSAVETTRTNSKASNFALKQNYPNPFNPTTTISFSIVNDSKVTLEVFNMLGQKVATLVDGFTQAGEYKVNFDASNLQSGMYVYQLKTGKAVHTNKMLLLK